MTETTEINEHDIDPDDIRLPHPYKIFVNTRPHIHLTKHVRYEHLVKVSGMRTSPDQKFSIAYSDGPPANPEGEMGEGQRVEIKNGMMFDVAPTNLS